MLQIIGWLGCLYLFVKGLEILSSSAHRTEDGKLTSNGKAAAIISILGSVLFLVLVNSQASASSVALPTVPTSSSASYSSAPNVDENLTSDEMNADMNAVDLNATDVAPTNLSAKY